MAAITDLVAARFEYRTFDLSLIASFLDVGIMNAGKMAEVVHDLAVHPNREIDTDALAAASLSLIALLGHLGPFVDTLADLSREDRAGAQAG